MHPHQLTALQNLTPGTVSVTDVADGGDRTLLLGRDRSKRVLHVWLEEGRIHRHVYDQTQTYRIGSDVMWYVEDLACDGPVQPERTDFTFARLLIDRGAALTFAPYDHWMVLGGEFYGRTAPVAPAEANEGLQAA